MSEEKDHMLGMMIKQGYVPEDCVLDGELVLTLVNEGETPCIGCNAICPHREAPGERSEKRITRPLSNKGNLRFMGVEDKASGTGLIQKIERDNEIPIQGIQREKDKVTRAHGCVLWMIMGKVRLPKNAPWMPEYIAEFRKFNAQMTHKHDDQIDPTLDAINEEFGDDELASLGFTL